MAREWIVTQEEIEVLTVLRNRLQDTDNIKASEAYNMGTTLTYVIESIEKKECLTKGDQ